MWRPSPINNLETLADKIKPVFSGFSIAPTFKCDCRCKFCHTWGNSGWANGDGTGNTSGEIDLDVLMRFINEMSAEKKRDRLYCTISGGESLLYSKFDELVKFLYEKDFSVHVITDATMLNKHIESISKNVEEVTVSLSGPPEINNDIRGRKNHFEDACDGIEHLLKKKIEDDNPFPNIMINFVLSKYTQNYIEDFIASIKKRFEHLGTAIYFDYDIAVENPQEMLATRRSTLVNGIAILFEPLLFTDSEQGKLYQEEMMENFGVKVTDTWKGLLADDPGIDISLMKSTLEKLWKENGIDSKNFVDIEEYFTDVKSVFGRTRCLTPWQYLRVRPDGTVNFCSDLPDYVLGNINDSSFNEIWEGERAEKFREVMRKKLLPMCYRCDGLMRISEELFEEK